MRDAACCLPDLLENHSSLVSHKALSRNPRTSIQIIRKSHFHLLLNVIIVNESQFYLSTAYILLGSNGLWQCSPQILCCSYFQCNQGLLFPTHKHICRNQIPNSCFWGALKSADIVLTWDQKNKLYSMRNIGK